VAKSGRRRLAWGVQWNAIEASGPTVSWECISAMRHRDSNACWIVGRIFANSGRMTLSGEKKLRSEDVEFAHKSPLALE